MPMAAATKPYVKLINFRLINFKLTATFIAKHAVLTANKASYKKSCHKYGNGGWVMSSKLVTTAQAREPMEKMSTFLFLKNK